MPSYYFAPRVLLSILPHNLSYQAQDGQIKQIVQLLRSHPDAPRSAFKVILRPDEARFSKTFWSRLSKLESKEGIAYLVKNTLVARDQLPSTQPNHRSWARYSTTFLFVGQNHPVTIKNTSSISLTQNRFGQKFLQAAALFPLSLV